MPIPPGQPPIIPGITETEESPMHQLILNNLQRGDRGDGRGVPEPKRSPKSGALVRDIVSMLTMLAQMDPRLSGRANRAIDTLTGADEATDVRGGRPASITRFGGGGQVKTPV